MDVTRQISRRTILKATGAAAGAVGLATVATPSVAAGGTFAHPGLLHTGADLARMAAKVKAGASPYTAGYAKLTANRHAQSDWTPNPQAIVYRGVELRPRSTWPQNYGILYNDIHAAYQNALRYHVSGDSAHADTAVAILNAWSAKLTKVDGSADRFLAAGIYGYQVANAAELVRDHGDFELERFQKMLVDVFYSMSEDFLVNHNNGTAAPHYWPNWDLCNMACVLATGIFCDDQAKVERAVEYFKHGVGMGSIKHAIHVVHDDGLAEWMEAGRDQGHSLFGVGLMGTVCEMAWNQGIDLYGYDDNRFLKGAQYVAKWSLGGKVPYTPYAQVDNRPGIQFTTQVAPADPTHVRPVWAMIANHYTKRRGLSATYLTQIAAKAAPEGGGGDYGPNSGGFDQLGFGTLAFTRDKATDTKATPKPAASAPASGAASDARPQTAATASASASASPAAGSDLAATGSGEIVGWTAAAGVTAVAGGLLFLRRRDRGRHGAS
ncbi:alginate lyase family protein [Streptomyces sporangiiformans]|uniref:Tat pathway signal sequence domain protein n=1 Tax=Streptomyces sporangiiformans TaxID=2315329 RepID=A0A505DRT1_9ACTN|nr:alginate lyase family protein [Streptomyces sporangiiformans]TPQ24046.1 Tat pathway signal sequence domain protein [Streptomyces sporangiiformans]